MHLDLDQAAALAILAAAAFDVEAKPAGTVTAYPGGRQLREQFANWAKRPGVGDWIGARRSANSALIDHDCLVDLFGAAQRPISAWFLFRIVKTTEQCAPQNIVDQRGFSASRNTGHAGETTERERGLDIL